MIQLHVTLGLEGDALRLHFTDGKIVLLMRIQEEELGINPIEQIPALIKSKAEQMEWSLANLKEKE